MLTTRSIWLGVFILTAGACRQPDNAASGDTAGQRGDTSMANMPGMRGGAGGSEQTMAAMETHLRNMDGATASQMKAKLSDHRPAVANLIAQLDREMRDMNMTADASWDAALDSLRQDLRVMPDLSAQSLRDMMPAHSARIRRVIAMHRAMMANMGH